MLLVKPIEYYITVFKIINKYFNDIFDNYLTKNVKISKEIRRQIIYIHNKIQYLERFE